MDILWLDVVWLVSCVVSGVIGAVIALVWWSVWGGTWGSVTEEGGVSHEEEHK
jgi:hypothetical protein